METTKRSAKVQMCGSYVLVYDEVTNHEIFTLTVASKLGPDALVPRLLQSARKYGLTLTNVRDGKVWL